MANKIFFGETGAGKTTAAVEREALPHFRDGGIIVTQLAMNREAWVDEFGEEEVAKRLVILPMQQGEGGAVRFTFGAWEDFEKYLELRDEKGRGPMYVIDEAHKAMPAGMRFPVDKNTGQRVMDAFPNKLELLFTDQRHYLINLVLITQNPFRLAAPIVAQMHSSMYLENAETKGVKGGFTAKIWNGPPPRGYANVKYSDCDDAVVKPKKYNPETWRFFTSNTMNKTKPGGGGRELEGKYRLARSIWKQPKVLMMIPLLGAVLYFGSGVLSIGDRASPSASKSPAKPAQAKSATATTIEPAKAEYAQADVIADLGQVEQQVAVSDAHRWEARGSVVLVTADLRVHRYQRVGPVLEVFNPDGSAAGRAYLANFASHWGYQIQAVQCGWILTRADNVRHIYDNSCFGKIHAAEANSPAGSPSGAASRALEPTSAGSAAGFEPAGSS